MTKQEQDLNWDHRLAALEHEVRVIHSQLDDIRDIISRAYGTLSDANDGRSRSIQCLARHIEQIEERLDPAFNKTFPQQAEFISETQAIFDHQRKRPS